MALWGVLILPPAEASLTLTIGLRWVHIASACLALGGPFFMRYIVAPAARRLLEPAQAEELRQRVMTRWKKVVYLLILAFVVSGFYTFFAAGRWQDPRWTRTDRVAYQALFGIKVMLALGMFFLASALTGRAAALAKIRQHHRAFTTLFILLGFCVIALAGIMRALPLAPEPPAATLLGR